MEELVILLKKLWNKKIMFFLASLFIVVSIKIIMLYAYGVSDASRVKLAKRALIDMYQFSSAEQLHDQFKDLQKITTEDVYNSLTYDNLEKSKHTYLTYSERPVSIDFIACTPNYVTYTLKCDKVIAGRQFIFLYNVNKSGKLCDVREAELIDYFEIDN